MLVAQVSHKCLFYGPARPFFHFQRLGYRRSNQCRVTHRRQRHEEYPVAELVQQIAAYLEAETGLANAGRADQGEQAYVFAQEHMAHVRALLLTPNEGGTPGGKIGALLGFGGAARFLER